MWKVWMNYFFRILRLRLILNFSLFSFEYNIILCNVLKRFISIEFNKWLFIIVVDGRNNKLVRGIWWLDGITDEIRDDDDGWVEWRLCSIIDEQACITCGNAWKIKI